MPVKNFNLGTIESISKVLGDTTNGLTGSEITKFLAETEIPDQNMNSTKWKRIYDALQAKQSSDHCANYIVKFIQHVMQPSRNFNKNEWFESTRENLNKILSFEGLFLEKTGEIKTTNQAKTISEADARASKLKANLISRKVHPDVIFFCKAELLVDNYFHAVFEATKSIAEKIRNLTGLQDDGTTLIDEAFSFKGQVPHLAINSLQTQSEQSEQRGFMNLLKGIFGTFRNTTAHSPKITWKIEELDALDILSTISFIHRRLDNATAARKIYQSMP